MEVVKHETCLEYFRRRLREGWRCISLEGYSAVLLSPDGIRRELDLRNDIETLRPSGAGTVQEWDTGLAANVDEVEADDDTTFNVHDFQVENTFKSATFALPNSGVGAGTINSVKIYNRTRLDSCEGGQYFSAVYTYATLYQGFIAGLTGSYQTGSKTYNTNPNTSNPWTWNEIDALEAGHAARTSVGDTGTIRCTQVYVEVDYTPGATEKSSSDTGSGVDAYVSLETAEAKSSSDTGSGVEGTPMPAATLADSESGQGQGAISSQLAAIIAVEVGTSVELGGLLQDLIASELGQGSDSFVAKIEVPTRGGGMKLWI